MSKTRVMVCDDSAVMRRILTTVLSEDPELEVVYRARHGRDAIDHLQEFNPDIVVLDVEMPVMDGIETVAAIRKQNRTIPIVMFSLLTSRGAEATFDALSAGANDFATKPSGVGHLDQAIASVKGDLILKIKSLVRQCRLCRSTPVLQPAVVESARASSYAGHRPVEVVAIGASTGGPSALQTLLSGIPATFEVPILVVQHMPAVFTALLADRLNASCSLTVGEAVGNERVEPGHVWIARGDYHMEVVRRGVDLRLQLNQNEPEHSVRPAVDPLFRAVAQHYGGASLAVVLTGMGKDGLEGSRLIRKYGGQVLAQDELSSAVWGMPRKVAEAGLADEVLPLSQMAQAIAQRVRGSSAARSARAASCSNWL